MLLSSRFDEGERCFPACTSRRSASGRFVRRDSKVMRFAIDMSWGTVRGMVSPMMVLMKICVVSMASGLAERELEGDECILMACGVVVCLRCVALRRGLSSGGK